MIRVAKDGFDGKNWGSIGLGLVNGELMQLVRPVSGPDVWVPVQTYVGEVEYVDKRGRSVNAPPQTRQAGTTGGRDGT